LWFRECRGEEASLRRAGCWGLFEARRCLRELAAPHYTHELVKQALTLAVEDPAATEALFNMLKVRRV
jgi:hypothetical protein